MMITSLLATSVVHDPASKAQYPTEGAFQLTLLVVVAGFLALLLLNEKLELNEIIGSAIVLAGIAITFMRPGKQAL